MIEGWKGGSIEGEKERRREVKKMKKNTNYLQLSEGTMGLAPLPENDAAWKTKKWSMHEFSFWRFKSGQTQGLPLRWRVNPHRM
jgi:hypothetical protein